jgi:hypothetical protein
MVILVAAPMEDVDVNLKGAPAHAIKRKWEVAANLLVVAEQKEVVAAAKDNKVSKEVVIMLQNSLSLPIKLGWKS